MNDLLENRLRDAFAEAARTVEPATLRPLVAPRAPWHRRFRLRVPAVATAMTLGLMLIVPGGAHLLSLGERGDGASTAIAANLVLAEYRPGDPEIAVYLCMRGSPFRACLGRGPATAGERAVIERELRSMPYVESVTFVDSYSAYENFVRSQPDEPIIEMIRISDMPESFRLRMSEPGDWTTTMRAAQALPGVSNVINNECLQIFENDDPRIRQCWTD